MFVFLITLIAVSAYELCSNCTLTGLVKCSNTTEVFTELTWPTGSEIWQDESECRDGYRRVKCNAAGGRDRVCEKLCYQDINWGPPTICGGRTCNCRNSTICMKTFTGRGHNRERVEKVLCSFGRLNHSLTKRDEFDKKKPGDYIILDGNSIKLHKGPKTVAVHVTKNGKHSVVGIDQNQSSSEIATGPGHYIVQVEDSTGLIIAKEVTILGDECQFDQSCYFCWDLVGVPACSKRASSTVIRYGIGGFGIMLVMLMVCLLPWVVVAILWSISCSCWCMKKAYQGVLTIPKTKIARAGASKVKGAMESAADAFSTAPPALIVILMLMVPLAAACTNTIDSVTSLTNCVEDGGAQVCGLNTIVTSTFSAKGDKSCININANGTGFGIELTWINRTDVVVPEFQYYTAQYEGKSQSFVACPSTEFCDLNSGPEDPCSLVDPSDHLLGGIGFVPLFNNPGISFCERDSPNLGGCFFQTSTCRYKRCVLEPFGPICSVFVNRDFSSIYFFNLKITDPNGVVASGEFNMQTVDDEITGNWRGKPFKITMKLNGQFAGQDSGLERIGYTFLCGDELKKMIGSELGAPTKNRIGDIQSNDVDFSGPSAFAFDTSIITSAGTGCTFVKSAMSAETQAISATSLPFIESGNTFTVRFGPTGHRLVSDIMNAPPISVKMTIEADVRIEQVVNVVCPKASNATITGCWNCPSDGPKAVITIKSECAEGSVVVQSTGIVQPSSVSISKDEEEYTFSFTSQSKDVDEEWIFRGNGGISKIQVTGTLTSSDIDLGNLNNQTKTNNQTDISSEIALAFDDVFSGLGDWADYLIVVAIIIASVIAFALIVYCMCWARRSYKSAKENIKRLSGAEQEPLVKKRV